MEAPVQEEIGAPARPHDIPRDFIRQWSIHRISDAYTIHHTWLINWFREWGATTGSQRSVRAPVQR